MDNGHYFLIYLWFFKATKNQSNHCIKGKPKLAFNTISTFTIFKINSDKKAKDIVNKFDWQITNAMSGITEQDFTWTVCIK